MQPNHGPGEKKTKNSMKFWSKNSVEVGDFRVAKMFFLKKVWTPRKHREKMFPTFRGARRRHPGGIKQQQQQQQQQTF